MPRRATPFMLRGYYLDLPFQSLPLQPARHREVFAEDSLPLGYALPFSRAAHDFQAARLQAL